MKRFLSYLWIIVAYINSEIHHYCYYYYYYIIIIIIIIIIDLPVHNSNFGLTNPRLKINFLF